jgi:MFS family permease
MSEQEARKRWRPTRTSLLAGGIVIAGLLLTGLSWWFLLLTALGTFGPGVLREIGWLHDKDEFQRQADHRAGYHAFLTTGLAAFALVAFFRSGERAIRDPHNLATLFLALLWFTWLLSSLLAYWGPQKTAARILRGFGSVWLVFAIISNLGPEWTGWAALLLHPLLAVPFFALAWFSGRRPRIAGLLLLAVAVFFLWLFGWPRGNMGQVTQGVTFILFLGPLLASGVALLGMGKNSDCREDVEKVQMTGKT